MIAQYGRRPWPLLWVAIVAVVGFLPACPADEPASRPRAMESWIQQALQKNPRMVAATARVDRARANRDGVNAFFDPTLTAAAGHSDWLTEVPAVARSRQIDPNTASGRLGIEAPLRPGAYLGVGASSSYLLEPEPDGEALYQGTLGARLEIPLLKDRGFAEWRGAAREAADRVLAARFELAAIARQVRHDVEIAYIDALRAGAGVQETTEAADRARRLLDEARQRAALKDIPEYQILAAQTDSDLRQADIPSARYAGRQACIRLAQLAGQIEPAVVDGSSTELMAWAAAAAALPQVDLEAVCRRRPIGRELDARISAQEARLQLARERARPNVFVSLSTTWRGTDPDSPFGNGAPQQDEAVGAEAALVWTQPLGFREPRATLHAEAATLAELRSAREALRLQIAADLAAAEAAWQAARERLALVSGAAAEARKALDAENERFRLGEGRSRNVLDAQKDLAEALQRRHDAAASLLRAACDWHYAAAPEFAEPETHAPMPASSPRDPAARPQGDHNP